MSSHSHHGLRPEHIGVYDQNHSAAMAQLTDMIAIHKAHIDDGCTTELSTACLTGKLIELTESHPTTIAVVLGVAVEKLAPHWTRS